MQTTLSTLRAPIGDARLRHAASVQVRPTKRRGRAQTTVRASAGRDEANASRRAILAAAIALGLSSGSAQADSRAPDPIEVMSAMIMHACKRSHASANQPTARCTLTYCDLIRYASIAPSV